MKQAYSLVATRPEERQKRNRRKDMQRLISYWLSVVAIVEATEKLEGYEIGAYLSVRDTAKLLGLEPALSNDTTGRRRHSPEQLRYVRDLIVDLPKGLTELVKIAEPA